MDVLRLPRTAVLLRRQPLRRHNQKGNIVINTWNDIENKDQSLSGEDSSERDEGVRRARGGGSASSRGGSVAALTGALAAALGEMMTR